MGSENGLPNEKAVHLVTLANGFWLGDSEVTQGQWRGLMGGDPSNSKGDDNLPVEQVSWEDAVTFCKNLTEKERSAGGLPGGFEYGLPTEAQWEYACRAGSEGDYAGDLDAMAWYGGNSVGRTHPVKGKRPNAWGLYDMHGNVWERCADWYGPYDASAVSDPTGPARSSERVDRGGGWLDEAKLCRSAIRNSNDPGVRDDDLGLRVALRSTGQQVGSSGLARGDDLAKAIAAGNIRVEFRGTGNSSGDAVTATVTTTERGGDVLELTVLPGTRLESGNPNVQDMVIAAVRGESDGGNRFRPCAVIEVGRNPRTYILEAYCAEFRKDNPSSNTGFSVGGIDRLLARVLSEGSNESIATKQAAVWIYTDRVGFSEVSHKFSVSPGEWSDAEALLKKCKNSLSGEKRAAESAGQQFLRGANGSAPPGHDAAVQGRSAIGSESVASAIFKTGLRYLYGNELPQDNVEALKCFQEAARQGCAQAECALGYCYLTGQGVSQDSATAVEWYQRAADHGNADAQYSLGYCYAYGCGATTNQKSAYGWFILADAAGNKDAREAIKRVEASLSAGEQREVQAWAQRWRPGLGQMGQ